MCLSWINHPPYLFLQYYLASYAKQETVGDFFILLWQQFYRKWNWNVSKCVKTCFWCHSCTDQWLAGFNLYLPDKVHAQQSLFSVNSLSGPDSLIAYADSLIVGSHFSPPHPGRLTENHRMGVLQLWDLDVCALQTEISEWEWGVCNADRIQTGWNRWKWCQHQYICTLKVYFTRYTVVKI